MVNGERNEKAWLDGLESAGRLAAAGRDGALERLRVETARLSAAGLTADEAFLVGSRRMEAALDAETPAKTAPGAAPAAGTAGDAAPAASRRFDTVVYAALVVLAMAAAKLPWLFADPGAVLLRNAGLLLMPSLAGVLAFRRRVPVTALIPALAAGLALALVVNLYPFYPDGQTVFITALAEPLLVWFACLAPFSGSSLPVAGKMPAYIRLSGEAVLFAVLAGCGVGVVVALTAFLFDAVGFRVEAFVSDWLFPCLVYAVPVVGVLYADSRKAGSPALAPVLAKLFVVPFCVLVAGFVVASIATGGLLYVSRDLAIGFDALLAVALAIAVFSLGADDAKAAGWLDWARLVLVVLALVADGLALGSMIGRVAAEGWTANRVAGLGMNVVLFADLAGLGVTMARCLFRGRPRSGVMAFQARYMWVIGGYLVFLAVGLPVLFGFG